MDVLVRLRQIGYRIDALEGKIQCHWEGQGKPDPDRVRPLLEELRQHKAEALRDLVGADAQALFSDPFAPEPYLPKGLIATSPDSSRPDWWIAWRMGTKRPVGHGADQWDAIMDLDRLDAEINGQQERCSRERGR